MNDYLFISGLALILLLSVVLWAAANIDQLEERRREIEEEISRIEAEQRKQTEGNERP